MPLSVYTGVCAPIMKYQGESNIAPAFARRITVIADSSSQAMRLMAGYLKNIPYPVAIEGAGMEQPKFDGMEVFAFETGQVDGTEDGHNVVIR